MYGMIRIRIDPEGARGRTDRLETIGQTAFVTVVLRLRSAEGVLDRVMMRQAVRHLAGKGITQAAVPGDDYLAGLLARYHIAPISHFSLMRKMAPQIMDYILQSAQNNAVLICARTVDRHVVCAAEHAARHYNTVMLECGLRAEAIRRELMDRYGAAALLGQVEGGAEKTAVLFFDRPPAGFRLRRRGAVTVALHPDAVPFASYNDVEVASARFGSFHDTDGEGVFAAIANEHEEAVREMHVRGLIKTDNL